ncbi:Photosystem I PsaA/PsaB [Cynara cardunculus var. scolymus]|uniref:Photosystem I PsaA/PsaB n=1 Tax=Cynara cardunculus var. scolymus TaxID=59895 RepID=A0A103YCQ2_CYNCS|nr:Photosystem I PsaA/PsaB [Cynara cardunculus var. scolymus]
MALRFPRFSQGLTQDPITHRIRFGIATAHDFESHDDITEERLYHNIFASHFGQLAIIFLWTSGNLFHRHLYFIVDHEHPQLVTQCTTLSSKPLYKRFYTKVNLQNYPFQVVVDGMSIHYHVVFYPNHSSPLSIDVAIDVYV